MSRLLTRWRGVVISLLGVAAVLWLAFDGSLGLYIHPRYFVFTVVMAVLAGVALIASFAVVPLRGEQTEDDGHGHDHGHTEGDAHDDRPRRRLRRTLGTVATGAAIAAAALLLVVFPPATLSTTSAGTAQLDTATAVSAPSTELLTGTDTATFSVKDWASVLRQGGDFADGRSADLTGFVMASPDDPDVFYLARYVITCCAVDAQPAGVPVHDPGWRDTLEEGGWVHAVGVFRPNSATDSTAAYLLAPTTVEPVSQPDQPYDY